MIPRSIVIEPAGERIRFHVHVTPCSSRTAVGGTRDGALVVRVTAPPVEGAANAAVTKALAAELGVRRADVALEAGSRGRRKLVSAPASARAALERLAATGE